MDAKELLANSVPVWNWLGGLEQEGRFATRKFFLQDFVWSFSWLIWITGIISSLRCTLHSYFSKFFLKDQPFHYDFICILSDHVRSDSPFHLGERCSFFQWPLLLCCCELFVNWVFLIFWISWSLMVCASIRCAQAPQTTNLKKSNGRWFSLWHLLTRLESDTSKGQRQVHRFTLLTGASIQGRISSIYYDQMVGVFKLISVHEQRVGNTSGCMIIVSKLKNLNVSVKKTNLRNAPALSLARPDRL